MTKTRAKARSAPKAPAPVFDTLLLGFCLCVMALRATYTEAPLANTTTLPSSMTDTVYSLTLSGLLIMALLAWLCRTVWRRQGLYRVSGIEIGLGLFLLAGVVSGYAATDTRLAITQLMMLLGPVAGAILLVQLLDSTARIRVVLLVLAALGIVSTYQCTEQRLVSNEITVEQYEKSPETMLEPLGIEPGSFQHFLFEHRLYSRGIRGFFTTSNSAASFAILSAFAAAGSLLISRRDKESGQSQSRPWLLPTIATGLIVIGLLLTHSKGGILGFLVAALLLGLGLGLRRRLAPHRRGALILLGSLAVVLILAGGYAVTAYGMRHGRLPGGNSMLVRWQYWRASAQMIADHPFTGVGPGNFAHNYPRYKPAAASESVADPHCFPLSFLAQFGPLGLLAFLAMLGAPLGRNVLSLTRTDPAPEDRASPAVRPLALTMLGITSGAMLLIRPLLIPTTPDSTGDLMLYELVVLFVAPVAAYLIGFLLLAAPLRSELPGKYECNWTVLTAILGCAALGVLVHNLIDFALFEPGVWTAFWIVIACLIAAGMQRRAYQPIPLPGSPAMRYGALTVTLLIGNLYYGFAWRPAYRATAYLQQAQQTASAGQFERAHHLLNAAFAADPKSPAAMSLNGKLYLQESAHSGPQQTASLEEAVFYFQKAIELNPADYKNYEKAGMACNRLGKNEEAYAWYRHAAECYPGCGRLHLQLGRIADQRGRSEAARQHYAEAIRIEEAFRTQFRTMYPERENVVSRLGEANFQFARQRLAELGP